MFYINFHLLGTPQHVRHHTTVQISILKNTAILKFHFHIQFKQNRLFSEIANRPGSYKLPTGRVGIRFQLSLSVNSTISPFPHIKHDCFFIFPSSAQCSVYLHQLFKHLTLYFFLKKLFCFGS